MRSFWLGIGRKMAEGSPLGEGVAPDGTNFSKGGTVSSGIERPSSPCEFRIGNEEQSGADR